MSSGKQTLTVICIENIKKWAKYAPLGSTSIKSSGWRYCNLLMLMELTDTVVSLLPDHTELN